MYRQDADFRDWVLEQSESGVEGLPMVRVVGRCEPSNRLDHPFADFWGAIFEPLKNIRPKMLGQSNSLSGTAPELSHHLNSRQPDFPVFIVQESAKLFGRAMIIFPMSERIHRVSQIAKLLL
ncbi:MAG TPA: hypothetical protein VGP63_17115 [Planctomycetaceae bacterium]|nr:hypothetical protein [Planctomycetaceae bacterium]